MSFGGLGFEPAQNVGRLMVRKKGLGNWAKRMKCALRKIK